MKTSYSLEQADMKYEFEFDIHFEREASQGEKWKMHVNVINEKSALM